MESTSRVMVSEEKPDRVTISLFSTETYIGDGYNPGFLAEAGNIKNIVDGLNKAADEAKPRRSRPQIVVSILLIPDWNRDGNSYKDVQYCTKQAEFMKAAKAKLEPLGVRVEDFYNECRMPDVVKAYMHGLKGLGSNADLIKTMAIINNFDRRHLQVDSNTVIPSFTELYNQTIGAEVQRDGLNASYYDDFYVSAHNKMVYTTLVGKLAQAQSESGLPLLAEVLFKWCDAHKGDTNDSNADLNADKKASKNSIYARVFAPVLANLLVGYTHEYALPESGRTVYAATLSEDTYWMTDDMVTALNMSWAVGGGGALNPENLKTLKAVKVGTDGEYGFQAFSNLVKKFTGDLSQHSRMLGILDDPKGEKCRQFLLDLSPHLDLELDAFQRFYERTLAEKPQEVFNLVSRIPRTPQGDILVQQAFTGTFKFKSVAELHQHALERVMVFCAKSLERVAEMKPDQIWDVVSKIPVPEGNELTQIMFKRPLSELRAETITNFVNSCYAAMVGQYKVEPELAWALASKLPLDTPEVDNIAKISAFGTDALSIRRNALLQLVDFYGDQLTTGRNPPTPQGVPLTAQAAMGLINKIPNTPEGNGVTQDRFGCTVAQLKCALELDIQRFNKGEDHGPDHFQKAVDAVVRKDIAGLLDVCYRERGASSGRVWELVSKIPDTRAGNEETQAKFNQTVLQMRETTLRSLVADCCEASLPKLARGEVSLEDTLKLMSKIPNTVEGTNALKFVFGEPHTPTLKELREDAIKSYVGFCANTPLTPDRLWELVSKIPNTSEVNAITTQDSNLFKATVSNIQAFALNDLVRYCKKQIDKEQVPFEEKLRLINKIPDTFEGNEATKAKFGESSLSEVRQDLIRDYVSFCAKVTVQQESGLGLGPEHAWELLKKIPNTPEVNSIIQQEYPEFGATVSGMHEAALCKLVEFYGDQLAAGRTSLVSLDGPKAQALIDAIPNTPEGNRAIKTVFKCSRLELAAAVTASLERGGNTRQFETILHERSIVRPLPPLGSGIVLSQSALLVPMPNSLSSQSQQIGLGNVSDKPKGITPNPTEDD